MTTKKIDLERLQTVLGGNGNLQDFLGSVGSDLLNIHSTFRAGHHDRNALAPIEYHAEIEFPVGFGIGLHDERLDLLPFRPSLLGLEWELEHHFRE